VRLAGARGVDDGLVGGEPVPLGPCQIRLRRELGLPTTYISAADPTLQVDVVPGRAAQVAKQS